MIYAVLNALAGLLAVYLLVLLVHYPHLRRMSWRNIRAQKLTAVLTAAGLAVSTALITMTLAASASMNRGTERAVDAHFGRIAYDLPANRQPGLDAPFFAESDAERIRCETAGGRADVLPVVAYVSTALVKGNDGRPLLLAQEQHVLGFDREAAVRFDPSAASIAPDALRPDEAILSESSARELDAQAGDTVYVLDNANAEHALRVSRVVRENGLSGYLGTDRASGTVLVHPDTARLLAGVDAGMYTNVLSTGPGTFVWQAVAVRDEAKAQLKDATMFVSALFGVTSSIAVLIGVVLVTNIFKMIAEERRQEMGILRAVGLGMRDLRILLQTEGLLYGVFSGVIGVAAGFGLAYLLISTVGRLIVRTFAEDVPETAFHADPSALAAGFSIGLLVLWICVWSIARRAAKRSIIDSLQPIARVAAPSKARTLRSIWLSFSTLLAMFAILLLTAVPDIREAWLNEDRMPLAFLVMFASVPIFVLALGYGLGLVRKVVLLAVRRSAGLTFALRMALGNMVAERARTGLMLLMFAAVSSFISFPVIYQDAMSQLMDDRDPLDAVGGYEYMARDPRKLSTESVAAGMTVPDGDGYRIAVVQQLLWREVGGQWGMFSYMVNGIDAAFAETNDVPLLRRGAAFADDRAAWREVASGGDAVILGEDLYYYTGGVWKVGDTFEIVIGDRSVSKRIAGIAMTQGSHPESYGIWVGVDALPALADGDHDIRSTVFINVEKRDRALELAVEKGLILQSISPVRDVVESENAYYVTGMYMIELFLRFNQLALLIGMSGLMVVMYRLIRRRRQQIGMLRAVGAAPRHVYGAVLGEGLFIGGLGITLGFAVGTYMSDVIFTTLTAQDTTSEMTLNLPFGKLALYYAASLAASAAVACLPAWQSVRVAPNEATRYVG